MRRGSARHHVEILRPTEVAATDGYGGTEPGAKEIIAERWASFEQAGGDESETGEQIRSENMWTVRMDYVDGLKSTDEVRRTEDGLTYKIEEIEDEDLRHVTHVLTVARVTPNE